MAREYFNAYHSYRKAIEPLTDAEKGRLFVALLEYSETGAEPELRGSERYVYPLMKSQIDRDSEKYASKCAVNRENGSRGGRANASERLRTLPNGGENDKTKAKTKDISPSISPPRHKYGEYGWVQLTDAEYAKLIADLGEAEAKRVIAYIDESAEGTKNKNGWKSWNAVLRKASRNGWGKQDTKPARNTRSTNHEQRKYTPDELQNVGKDLLDI